MSWRASAYIKQLVVCPNGERITRTEKLVALVLADSHQDKASARTYPAVKMIAEDSLMDPRVCRRVLAALERKGVIERERATNQGRGQITFYRFPELDSKQVSPEKEDTMSSFFLAKRRTEGGRKEDKTAPPSIEEQEQELKTNYPLYPPQAGEPGAMEATSDEASNCVPIRAAKPAVRPAGEERAIEVATDEVMKCCGFTARRLRLKLRAVVVQRVGIGHAPAEVAAAMVDAWQRYGKQGKRLFRHRSAAEFYEGGLWLNSNLWDWDSVELREEQMAMNARVGSR